TASQAGSESYTPADDVTQTLTVNKATLTVTSDGGQQKVYGQADPVFSYTVDGLQNSDDETIIQGVLSRDAGEDVGGYKLRQGTMDAGSNYSLVFHGDYFTVTPAALTITADADQQKIYGEADPAFTYAVSGLVNNDKESVLEGALSRELGEAVGDYKLRQGSLTAGNNYSLVFHGDYFTVAPAALTITADGGQQKVYGQADPVFTYAVSGLANNDDESVLQGALSRDPGEDVDGYKLRQGTLDAGNNYSLIFHGDYFTVTPAALTITANASQQKLNAQADSVYTYAV